MKVQTIIGNRVIKTGIAVFFTALICNWFDFPPTFAVITAIVTIEPTVTDSIKKRACPFPRFGNRCCLCRNISVFTRQFTFYLHVSRSSDYIYLFPVKPSCWIVSCNLNAIAMIEIVEDSYFFKLSYSISNNNHWVICFYAGKYVCFSAKLPSFNP